MTEIPNNAASLPAGFAPGGYQQAILAEAAAPLSMATALR
jgi:hypothetical protein